VDHDADAIYLPHSIVSGWHINSQVGPIDQSALVMLAGPVCDRVTGLVLTPLQDSLPTFDLSSRLVCLRCLPLLI
jgi:hypothetical protein